MITGLTSPSGGFGGWSVIPGLTATGEVKVGPLPDVGFNSAVTNNIRILTRGPEDAVWFNSRINGAWTGWTSLGGLITSDITLARTPRIPRGNRVVVRGSDRRVYLIDVTLDGNSGYRVLGDFRATSNVTVDSFTAWARARTAPCGPCRRTRRSAAEPTWRPPFTINGGRPGRGCQQKSGQEQGGS